MEPPITWFGGGVLVWEGWLFSYPFYFVVVVVVGGSEVEKQSKKGGAYICVAAERLCQRRENDIRDGQNVDIAE